MEEQNYSATHS